MKRLLIAMLLAAVAGIGWTPPAFAEKVLKVGVPANLNTLDPNKTKSGEEYLLNWLVYSSLISLDRSMSAQPDLAESWDSTSDLKTWTFRLRKGVKFHHGREFDAEDVVFTINRILDKKTGSKARSNFQIVDKMEAVDKYTVRFHLKEPYGGFQDLFASRQARIIPRDRVDTLSKEPSGTGPFKFVSYTPGDKIVLVKNPDYFKPGLPKVDRIIFRIIPESSSAVAALETGEIDMIWNLSLESIKRVESDPNLMVSRVATSSWDAIVMNIAHDPFKDIRVRQAINMVIDKKQMVDLALFGYGSPTNTPIPPTHPYFNKSLTFDPPDVAGAKKLLAEAGHADGFEITLYIPAGRPTRARLGVAARSSLQQIGITANLQTVPWDKFLSDIEGKAAFYVTGFFSRPTIDTSTWSWYHSSGSWNAGIWNYNNPEMDKILEAGRRSNDDAERRKIYGDFQALALNDSPAVIPYVLNHAVGYSKKVKNFEAHWMLILDLEGVTLE